MSQTVRFRSPSTARAAALCGLLMLAACANGQNYDTGTTSLGGVGLGTGAGAAAGALAGRAIAGGHDNTLAMLGGALLGLRRAFLTAGAHTVTRYGVSGYVPKTCAGIARSSGTTASRASTATSCNMAGS